MKAKRTPSQGLKILENLYKKFPKNQRIKNAVIDGSIKLGKHDSAIRILKQQMPIKNLRHQAWLAHKENNINQEREIWRKMLEQNYLVQIHAKIHTFIKRSNWEIKLAETDIPLFCVERNEMLRLPFFLQYYRKLGVTQFIFIDNNSDDGSFEFLLEQPDCHVFWTNDDYNQSGHGLIWLNHLVNETNILNTDQWYVIADVDEFLVYPHCETYPLKNLITYLNTTNAEAVPSFMLDMYAENLNDNSKNFLDTHIYFYNNYQIFHQAESPYIQPAGGIRDFIFNESNPYYVKTALFKKTSQIAYLISSSHQTTPYQISALTTTFLHYKFVGDFLSYAKTKIDRKQHSGGASRYRIYHNWAKNNACANLLDLDKTTKYQNSRQLVNLGLIKTTDEWERFCERQ